jgi:hypothetical protein
MEAKANVGLEEIPNQHGSAFKESERQPTNWRE